MRLGFALAFVLSLSTAAADAEPTNIAVLPIRASVPPTSDPTLLRLTEEVGRAIHEAADGTVRVVSRELRDETCPSNQGSCPNDVASLLRADRVVSLWLDDDHAELILRVYGALRGLERELKLACKREGTRVQCDTKPLRGKLAQTAPAKLEPAQVEKAFGALGPRLEACLGKKPTSSAPASASSVEVHFQIDDRGRAAHVRIEPRKAQGQRRYRCMARVVEELSLSGDGRGLGPFRFPLPGSTTSSP